MKQEYGFATITGNDFRGGEFIEFVKGVYYKNAINTINDFWKKFNGQGYFCRQAIKYFKEDGLYEP
jgi:hypothetical protein